MEQIKVLIVEDEGIVALDLDSKLTYSGYNVVGCATSFEEGIELIEKNQPNVILMDIIIEGPKTGIDLSKVAQNKYNIPVIFVTANSNKGIIDEVKQIHPYGFVSKPFNVKDLTSAIEIAYHKHSNEKSKLEHEKKLNELNKNLEKRIMTRTGRLMEMNTNLKLEIESRNRVEKSLFSSQQLYKNTVKNLGSGLVIVSTIGQIISANNSICLFLKCSKKMLTSKNIIHYFSESEWESIKKMFEDKTNELWFKETKIKTKDNTKVWCKVYVSKSEDNYVFSIINIHKQKLGEIALYNARKERIKTFIAGEQNERTRISKDLHDSLSQKLTAAKFSIAAVLLSKQLEKKQQQVLGETKKIIEETLLEVREISHNLSPTVLSDYGFEAALEKMCSRLNANKKIKITLLLKSNKTRLTTQVETTLYRIAQEIINNTLKHANAKKITLYYENNKDFVLLQVTDDGIGFDKLKIDPSKVNGLNNVKERVDSINAKLIIESQLNKGTLIGVELLK